MGERTPYQPLTFLDRLTVVLYRAGILLAAASIATAAVLLWQAQPRLHAGTVRIALGAFLLGNLLSAAFIHLYARSFRRAIRTLGLLAAAALAGVLLGSPSPVETLLLQWYGALTLGLFAAVLAFVAVKEAFCFRLNEGYVIALLLPLLVAAHVLGAPGEALRVLLSVTAVLLLVFTARKVAQPLHYDIGDKTQYR